MIEGNYKATVTKHEITEKKNGEAQVVVTFDVQTDSPLPEQVKYYGYFSEKALPYTIKNLITLGLKGNNPAGEIEIGKVVDLKIENETYLGKTRAKVKFINEVGATPKAAAMSPDLAKAKLSSLEGAVMKARLELDKDEPLPF